MVGWGAAVYLLSVIPWVLRSSSTAGGLGVHLVISICAAPGYPVLLLILGTLSRTLPTASGGTGVERRRGSLVYTVLWDLVGISYKGYLGWALGTLAYDSWPGFRG